MRPLLIFIISILLSSTDAREDVYNSTLSEKSADEFSPSNLRTHAGLAPFWGGDRMVWNPELFIRTVRVREAFDKPAGSHGANSTNGFLYMNDPQGANQLTVWGNPSAETIAYEFGILLGMRNEHQRFDRDTFVRYDCTEINGYEQALQHAIGKGYDAHALCTDEYVAKSANSTENITSSRQRSLSPRSLHPSFPFEFQPNLSRPAFFARVVRTWEKNYHDLGMKLLLLILAGAFVALAALDQFSALPHFDLHSAVPADMHLEHRSTDDWAKPYDGPKDNRAKWGRGKFGTAWVGLRFEDAEAGRKVGPTLQLGINRWNQLLGGDPSEYNGHGLKIYLHSNLCHEEPPNRNFPSIYPRTVRIKWVTSDTLAEATVGMGVGDLEGQNSLYISEDCPATVLAHEIAHVLGMNHEHSYTDRDIYLRYDCTKVVGYEEGVNCAKDLDPPKTAIDLCNDINVALDCEFADAATADRFPLIE
ncbi:hypothetical protein BCR34DRAFT_596739 [Clohesyomyces aquaticus]|uniref:Peptidase M12A domain-containing protein n=1 Tax=Clohesyomyces aquaticus TaxID=1231657 RepID=A0A1Y2A5U5_9PLEO|nr:hypothetical protein BCR34DRAFT_596739 [Clohesyomyces aquaticus]